MVIKNDPIMQGHFRHNKNNLIIVSSHRILVYTYEKQAPPEIKFPRKRKFINFKPPPFHVTRLHAYISTYLHTYLPQAFSLSLYTVKFKFHLTKNQIKIKMSITTRRPKWHPTPPPPPSPQILNLPRRTTRRKKQSKTTANHPELQRNHR